MQISYLNSDLCFSCFNLLQKAKTATIVVNIQLLWKLLTHRQCVITNVDVHRSLWSNSWTVGPFGKVSFCRLFGWDLLFYHLFKNKSVVQSIWNWPIFWDEKDNPLLMRSWNSIFRLIENQKQILEDKKMYSFIFLWKIFIRTI